MIILCQEWIKILCKISSKNSNLQAHPHVLCEFLYTLPTTIATTGLSALVGHYGALYHFWHSCRKYVKHQTDIQARNEQTNEPDSFCSERHEALVCCTRNLKHSLRPYRWMGLRWRAMLFVFTPADFYLRYNLKAIMYSKRVNTRHELWRSFEVTVTSM